MTDITLESIADVDRLTGLIESKHIAVTAHPSGGYWILNYTPKTQYEGHWVPETKMARGLVIAGASPTDPASKGMARPFPKFHNASEHFRGGVGLEPLPLRDSVRVTAKMDGSLGILYLDHSGDPKVATRGSFTSDQALWASAHYTRHYADTELVPGATYLFEIIYPANRIVVNYHGLADLVLLAVLDTASGTDLDMPDNWPGPVVETFPYGTLDELIAAVDSAPVEIQANAEGFVACFESGLRTKVKYSEYVRLHRIVTGVDTKMVYRYTGVEVMSPEISTQEIAMALGMELNLVDALVSIEGGPFAELLESVPDEFYDWVSNQAQSFRDAAAAELAKALAVYEATPPGLTPRERAEYVKSADANPSAVFNLLAGKSPEPVIWKWLRPQNSKPYFARLEAE